MPKKTTTQFLIIKEKRGGEVDSTTKAKKVKKRQDECVRTASSFSSWPYLDK